MSPLIHGRVPAAWPDQTFTPEALAQMAAQADGMIVTYNWRDDEPLGRVVRATVDDTGLALTIDVPDHLVASAVAPPVTISPGTRHLRSGDRAELMALSALPHRPAADPMRSAMAKLCGLILDDMARATNQDLARDGPVGDEEGKVWERIEAAAREARGLL